MNTADNTLDANELLRLLQQNNEEGFAKIYRALWPSLFDTAYKRLKDKEKCQDIVQNVFADLWHRKDKVVITNLSAYLHTAVRFQVYKHALKLSPHSDFFGVLDQALESCFRADDTLITKELSTLVQLWIEALPSKRRKIFLMRYTEELSTQEIANRLNISQKTVQNQLNTATLDIKSRLTHLTVFFWVLLFIK